MSYLDILVGKNIVDADAVTAAEFAARSGKKTVDQLLIESGISQKDILEAKGEYYNLPVKRVENLAVAFEILNYIPEESVHHYGIVPLGIKDGVLEVGTVDPENLEARDALLFISTKEGIPYKVYLISNEDFEKVFEGYRGLSGEVTRALSELELELSADEQELSRTYEELSKEETTTRIVEDAPVTKIVATVLRYAIDGNASDIHLEPMGNVVRVRFRVDGVLHTSLSLPIKVHQAVVARVKILSNMKLDERRKPQDNRFSAHISGRKIDFRVSTFPAVYGEKIVIRILDPEKGVRTLDQIGLSPENLEIIRRNIRKPYGLILISGPTGSGKTTTLYSMLKEVDTETQNVLSLEDPVEYNVAGMSQSQVRPEIGYTFATGLRTTLRQDPDIIMVGEIRDKETAGLAIQAALTGHLVLSTIHTNNAAGVIPRLIDMGIEPYLIAPTLILAMAQRLVRTLCPGGGEAMPVEGSLKLIIDKEFEDLPDKFKKKLPLGKQVFRAKPTAECPNGTRGRMAVFEILEIDKEMERTILTNATSQDVMKAGRQKGMLTMKEDAILKAFEQKIPFEEVNTLGSLYDGE